MSVHYTACTRRLIGGAWNTERTVMQAIVRFTLYVYTIGTVFMKQRRNYLVLSRILLLNLFSMDGLVLRRILLT